jgi:hypothetical protein
MRRLSQAPSVMTRIGPSFGKSVARSSRSMPGWSTVPPRPRTRIRPAIDSGGRYPSSYGTASQKITRAAGTSRAWL